MLKPYDKYKPTEYDWLSKVPSHWCPYPMRAITSLSDERNGIRGNSELLSVYREYGVIRKKSRDDNHNVESSDLSNYKYVHSNDLVMNKMKMWQGSLGISPYNGIVSPAYIVCKISLEMNYKYLHYLLRSPLFKTFYNRISYGIRVGQWDMRYNDFKSLYIYLPPREEQDQIVRFLDWKLAKINKLIRTKKKQIALLIERIDTMTNNAIKMDGINIQRLCNISSKIGSWITRENDLDYISIGLLNRGRGIFHKPPIKGSDLGDSEFFIVEDNALILSGQFAWEGAVALTEKADEGCIASHRYYMIRGKEGLVKNEYLWAFFRTKYGDMLLNLYSRGAAGRNRPLNINYLLKEHIPIPPIEVQEKIAQEVKLLQQYVRVVNRFEEFLSEYRTRLISDVVTGKVDVRGIEIPEYEYVEEESDEESDDTEGADEEAEEQEDE